MSVLQALAQPILETPPAWIRSNQTKRFPTHAWLALRMWGDFICRGRSWANGGLQIGFIAPMLIERHRRER
jgi:hypothetical protein